jgi:hypothetical protein
MPVFSIQNKIIAGIADPYPKKATGTHRNRTVRQCQIYIWKPESLKKISKKYGLHSKTQEERVNHTSTWASWHYTPRIKYT